MMGNPHAPVPWLAVGMLSATALAYEVLLTRLFAIVHWHHLAATIISLALLGYGASGTFLSLFRHQLVPRFAPAFVANAVLFSLSLLGCFALARRIALDPLALAWEVEPFLRLAAIFTVMAVPFFAVANCIGLALWRFRTEVPRIYAADLLGAGTGALAVVAVLLLLHPTRLLWLLAALGLVAAAIGARQLGWQRAPLPLLAAGAALAAGAFSAGPVAPAAYKDLAQAQNVVGAEVVAEASGPLGVATLVRNDQVPTRHAPGLSLLPRALPPAQQALFVDGDAAGVVVQFDGRRPPAYLRDQTSAMPYAVLEAPRVLVLEAGGGAGVLQALAHGARQVDAVELHSAVIDLLRSEARTFSGELYGRSDVRVHLAEARAFLAHHAETFDLIQMTASADAAGLGAQREVFAHTVEAYAQALQRLTPAGVLAVSGATRAPPRLALRLLATASAALQQRGVEAPAQHIAMLRGWQYFTLLVSRAPLSDAAVAALRDFARQRAFDLVWLPGMQRAEANRSHRLAEPYFHDGARALLGPGRERFIADYPFQIAPATDDRPYAYRFVRAASIPDWWGEAGGSGLGQLDWGYVLAAATLLLALVIGAVLILLPLALAGRSRRDAPNGWRWRTPLYFGLIGIAFLFVEITYIQRFQLFLGHPLYAVALVLAGFLVFAGLGSRFSARWANGQAWRGLAWAIGIILAVILLYVAWLPQLLARLELLPAAVRAAAGLALIAPLAFAMGMPFPLGLSRLTAEAPQLLPWAWGVNGCASVVSAVATPLLAMEVGFSGVLLVAALLYAATLLALPRKVAGSA
jgi:spermidine synthase